MDTLHLVEFLWLSRKTETIEEYLREAKLLRAVAHDVGLQTIENEAELIQRLLMEMKISNKVQGEQG